MQASTRDATRRSPRQQRSRAKVEAILHAVEELAAHDIDALTTSTIAERAGISVGSLYQYFENREDIVERLLERYRNDIDELMEKAFADAEISSVRGGFVVVIDRYVEFIRSRPAFRVLWYSTEFPNPHRIVLEAAAHGLTASFVDGAFRHGLLADADAKTYTRVFASWLAIDAVIHAAFRFDVAGDAALLMEAKGIASHLETPAAA